MNTVGGIRTLLTICTTNRAQVQTIAKSLAPNVLVCSANRKTYSVAEMIFRTEKRRVLAQQELCDESGRTALVLCATRPESVRTLEKLCGLPD